MNVYVAYEQPFLGDVILFWTLISLYKITEIYRCEMLIQLVLLIQQSQESFAGKVNKFFFLCVCFLPFLNYCGALTKVVL